MTNFRIIHAIEPIFELDLTSSKRKLIKKISVQNNYPFESYPGLYTHTYYMARLEVGYPTKNIVSRHLSRDKNLLEICRLEIVFREYRSRDGTL